MSYNHRHILCGCLLAVALGSGRAIAQDEPAVKITPSGEPTKNQPASSDTDQPFKPIPSAPAARSASAVTRLLAEDDDYKSGDLLTWERVKPVLDRLRRGKVPMPSDKELKEKFLSENDSLVKMLSSKDGKAFFQKLSKDPASIDMVDHYRTLPYGNQFLREFIRDVDGYKFFTTRTWMDAHDAKWAETHTLANVPGGQKFGEPTGRIYLESQLISFLANYQKSGAARSYE